VASIGCLARFPVSSEYETSLIVKAVDRRPDPSRIVPKLVVVSTSSSTTRLRARARCIKSLLSIT